MKIVMLHIGILLCIFARLEFNGFAQSKIITTYAGSGFLTNGTHAIDEPIGSPASVAIDGSGGFYVASSNLNRVFRVAADGTINVIAGIESGGYSGDGGPATAAQLNNPQGIALDSAGNLYIADSYNHRIRKVTNAGIINTVAGNGTAGFSGDGGPAAAARLNYPNSITVDYAGNIFIADCVNDRIRKVATTGVISTLAGNGTTGFSGDGGPAIVAQLARPQDVAVDSASNLYIADLSNGRIRKVTASGTINTVAGGGNDRPDGVPAASAHLGATSSVTVDSAGNLYIADDFRIYRVTTAGIINTLAGVGGGSPSDVVVDSAGNIYIAEFYGARIRKVTNAGIIDTVAGNGTYGYGGDGGPASSAHVYYPTGAAFDSVGNIWIVDSGNMRIRKVTTAGVISTVAASGGEPATPALFASPQGVARDSEGNLYVAETGSCLIRKITSEGVISTVAGNLSMSSVGPLGEGAPYTNCFYGGDGGPATSAHLANPIGIAIDSAGNLYIADSSWGYEYAASNRIRKVTVAGVISTVAGGGHGGDGGLATSAYLIQPTGVAVDSAGNIYIADSGNSRIRKVNTAGIISSVAGNGTSGYSGDGEQATQAQLNNPIGVALDSAGNIYIADSSNNRVRKVSSAGIINTVAGNGTSGFSGDGEQATQAQLNYPTGVAVDFAGSLYIADSNNNRIRKVTTILSPTIITALVSSITQTTASGGGNVTSDGGASIIARGVCWSTSVNPTTSDVCTADGTGTGTFFSSITGLTANTSYHVRAYAMNIAGTAYGADAPFTALPLDPDFRIGTGSGGSFSAVTTAGSRAVYNLAVTGKNNFSGSVTFACSGLPAATACSFSSNPLNVSGTSTAPFTITISTTASTSSTNIPKGVDHLPWNGSAAVVLCLGGLATIAGMSRRRRLSFALLALCSIGIVGCRGGSKKKTTPVQGTPAGTYSVVLTAASGGISHNSNLTLIVQ